MCENPPPRPVPATDDVTYGDLNVSSLLRDAVEIVESVQADAIRAHDLQHPDYLNRLGVYVEVQREGSVPGSTRTWWMMSWLEPRDDFTRVMVAP